VFCTAAAGLQGAQFAAVVSPVFVMMLLRFVSGIPLQEKQAQARWGATPEYQAYLARTNLLIPLPKPCGTKQQ
jgi:steroid 5-alpha reductase family enzyme